MYCSRNFESDLMRMCKPKICRCTKKDTLVFINNWPKTNGSLVLKEGPVAHRGTGRWF